MSALFPFSQHKAPSLSGISLRKEPSARQPAALVSCQRAPTPPGPLSPRDSRERGLAHSRRGMDARMKERIEGLGPPAKNVRLWRGPCFEVPVAEFAGSGCIKTPFSGEGPSSPLLKGVPFTLLRAPRGRRRASRACGGPGCAWQPVRLGQHRCFAARWPASEGRDGMLETVGSL